MTPDVARELARALAELAAGPVHIAGFLLARDALRREVAELLERPASPDEPPAPGRLPSPLRLFLSCAEPSGELHAVNLLHEMRSMAPRIEVAGLGGGRLAAAGLTPLGDPVRRAAMGFGGVLGALPFYVDLLDRCAAHLRAVRPHVAVLVDSPALHVPLGRIARRHGVPVLHFVTPQHWAWAPWRTRSYARAVDRALTILPFEREWFARRGVAVAHVGHPLLDELEGLASASPASPCRSIAVLPGSRAGVIERNLPWMLEALRALRERVPDADVMVLQQREQHRGRVERIVREAGAASWASVDSGSLHEHLARARVAFSVSGTVLIDVLHHRLPTVCIYRVAGARDVWLRRHALVTPFFASLNLLAGGEVIPEFCFHGRGPLEQVVAALHRAYTDEPYRDETKQQLDRAAQRLGPPGATRRAARHALALASHGAARTSAA